MKTFTYSQSTGHLTDEQGNVVAVGFAGNDSRPGVNPQHIPGYCNPEAEAIHLIGPLPRGLYDVGKWQRYPKVGSYAAPLTQIEGESFGRNGFFIHGPSEEDPLNSSEGCIVIPHTQRMAVMKLDPDRIRVVA